MKAALILVFALVPVSAFGGFYKCVENGKVTFSDQACKAPPKVDTDRVVRPAPQPPKVRLASAAPAPSSAEEVVDRKVLQKRLEEADKELMWLYRERRAALETYIEERLAEAGEAGLSEEELALEREAFKASYENSIKILRRELVDLRRQLDDPDNAYRKAAYAAR